MCGRPRSCARRAGGRLPDSACALRHARWRERRRGTAPTAAKELARQDTNFKLANATVGVDPAIGEYEDAAPVHAGPRTGRSPAHLRARGAPGSHGKQITLYSPAAIQLGCAQGAGVWIATLCPMSNNSAWCRGSPHLTMPSYEPATSVSSANGCGSVMSARSLRALPLSECADGLMVPASSTESGSTARAQNYVDSSRSVCANGVVAAGRPTVRMTARKSVELGVARWLRRRQQAKTPRIVARDCAGGANGPLRRTGRRSRCVRLARARPVTGWRPRRLGRDEARAAARGELPRSAHPDPADPKAPGSDRTTSTRACTNRCSNDPRAAQGAPTSRWASIRAGRRRRRWR